MMLRFLPGPALRWIALVFALALVTGCGGGRRAPATPREVPASPASSPASDLVQGLYESGLAHARRNEFAEAAQAFDRCAEADPRFAYAYYHAGLAYDRLNRADLMVIRLEMFLRLAPDAPERPEVEAILSTVRR